MPSLLLGFDIGTGSSKGAIIDENGSVIANHSVEHEIIHPKLGWAEQDPEKHWWGNFVEITRALIRLSNVAPSDIKGICISGQQQSLVFLNKRGRPLGNGILYLDNRASKEVKIAEKIVRYPFTGEEASPRIIWFRKNKPKIFSQVRMILEPSNYVVYRLTGLYSIDHLLAIYFGGIYDVKRLKWCEEICDQMGIFPEILPPVYAASTVIGEVTREASEETGLKKGTPVVVGTGDQIAQMLSVGVIKPGDSLINYASAGVFLVCTCDLEGCLSGKDLSKKVEITATYLPTMGSLLRWFRDEFSPLETRLGKKLGISAYQILDEEASKIDPGSNGLIILPFFMGKRAHIADPVFDPFVRGAICGLTLYHTRKHVYRALLESFGYGIYGGLIALEKLNIIPKRTVATGGGAKSRLWRQIVSDTTGMPQEYVDSIGAPYGNAYLAGYGIGIFKDFEFLKQRWIRVTEITRPKSHKIYERLFVQYQDLSDKLSTINFPEN